MYFVYYLSSSSEKMIQMTFAKQIFARNPYPVSYIESETLKICNEK